MFSLPMLLLYAIIITMLCGGCAGVIYSTKNLPPDYRDKIKPKFEVPEFSPSETPIAKIYEDEIRHNQSNSGAMLLKSGTYALLHRIALVRMAEKTIEMQTYIYENDPTSRLLMYEMKLAADKGVKIRILVDDNGLDSDHSDIMTLDYHPNIEVKVFNPFKYRSRALRIPQLIFDLARMNHRMHNKLFIVDGAATIIGGRNVASNYFDAGTEVNFSDTDVLFIGGLAEEALKSFNQYWNYHKSIPVSVFPERDKPETLTVLEKEILGILQHSKHKLEINQYESMLESFIEAYNKKENPIYWGKGALIGDNPIKTEKGGEEISPIVDALRYLWAKSTKSVYIVSAYLIPGYGAAQDASSAAGKGLKIKILTNSLSSTDAKIVYAAWIKYRDELLENHVQIYEYRNEGYKIKNRVNSTASLHSKVMVFDEKIVWVGSFNLDGRSAAINTEVAAIFHNEEFAAQVIESIEEDMSGEKSWQLSREKNKTLWKTMRDGKEITYDHCPDTSAGMRFLINMLRWVPEKFL